MFSSFQSHPQSAKKDQRGSGDWSASGAELAHSAVVSTSDAASHGSSTCAPQKGSATNFARKTTRDTPPSREIGTTGLSLTRKQFENQGLSQSTDIILNAWRPSTVKQYMPYIRKWETYCSQQQIDPIHTNISQVLNFLTQLFNTGVGYSAINTAKSALSALIVLSDSRSLGQHSLVTRYIKGVFESRPSLPTLDVSLALNWLITMDYKTINLKQLTLKVTLLLSLLTGETSNITVHRITTYRFYQ